MKRITLVIALLALSVTIALSQNTNSKKAEPKKSSSKYLSPEMKQAEKDGTLHYYYKEGKLTNCMGTKWNTQLQDVKLKNGTVLTRKGKLKFTDGKFGQLEDGQCISLAGEVTDHKAAHSNAMATAE